MFRLSPMHLFADYFDARHVDRKRAEMDSLYDTNLTIHKAAEEGDVSLLSDYLKHSTLDINVKTFDGDTAMLLAAKNWHERAVQLLIEHGADINCTDSDNWTILHYACLRGWIEIVQFFAENKDFNINAKNCQGQTALMIAVEERNEDVAEVLLKYGADVTCCDENEWNLLHYASHFRLYSVVHYILEKKLCPVNSRTSSGDTPLLLAADNHDGAIAQLLVNFKADIKCCNSENYNFLHYAIKNHWAEAVRGIVNRKSFDLNVRTSEGHTALYIACAVLRLSGFHRKQTCLEIIGILLSAGVDCNLKTNYDKRALTCVLVFYVSNEEAFRCSAIKLLIEHGAYLTSSDYYFLYERQELKQGILKDGELCTRILMNNFNHVHLPALYETPLVSHLPPNIKGLQIDSNKGVAGDIKSCVNSDIKTKEFCNVMEVRPMVLQMMCVQSLIGYYSTLKQSAPSRSNNSSVTKPSLMSNSSDLNYLAPSCSSKSSVKKPNLTSSCTLNSIDSNFQAPSCSSNSSVKKPYLAEISTWNSSGLNYPTNTCSSNSSVEKPYLTFSSSDLNYLAPSCSSNSSVKKPNLTSNSTWTSSDLNYPAPSCSSKSSVKKHYLKSNSTWNTNDLNYPEPSCSSNSSVKKPYLTSNSTWNSSDLNYQDPSCSSNSSGKKPYFRSNNTWSRSDFNYSAPSYSSNSSVKRRYLTSNSTWHSSDLNYPAPSCSSNSPGKKPYLRSNSTWSRGDFNYSTPSCSSNSLVEKPYLTSNSTWNSSNLSYPAPFCSSKSQGKTPYFRSNSRFNSSNFSYSEPSCSSNSSGRKPYFRSNSRFNTSDLNYSEPSCSSNSSGRKPYFGSNSRFNTTDLNYSEPSCSRNSSGRKPYFRSNSRFNTTDLNCTGPSCSSNSSGRKPYFRSYGKFNSSDLNYLAPSFSSNSSVKNPSLKSNSRWNIRDLKYPAIYKNW